MTIEEMYKKIANAIYLLHKENLLIMAEIETANNVDRSLIDKSEKEWDKLIHDIFRGEEKNV